MKNLYFAAVKTENGKNYAYVIKVPVDTNILTVIKQHNPKILHTCETQKQARELVTLWNKSYKNNGTYMFDNEPPF